MRLSDIMSHVELTLYPLVALVIFLGVFVLVVGRALRTDRARHDRWARIPLADQPVEPRAPGRRPAREHHDPEPDHHPRRRPRLRP